MTDPSGSEVNVENVDPSGSVVNVETVDPSGSVVNVETVDPSGSVVNVETVDPSGSVVNVETVDPSGSVVNVGITDLSGTTGMLGVPTPPRVTIADILASQEVLTQTEAMDRAILNSIGQMSIDALRSALIRWATEGFPNAYAIQDIVINPPPRCSDGVTRNLADYITFCSGKTIQEHVAVLQDMLPDIAVAFCYTGASIQIVVSRPTV